VRVARFLDQQLQRLLGVIVLLVVEQLAIAELDQLARRGLGDLGR